MKITTSNRFLSLVYFLLLTSAQQVLSQQLPTVAVTVYPDSVLNDVSNSPIGINLDFLMDDDKYLKPKRRLVDALKAMGVKYLRYPGGNKSDFYTFSRPPYSKSVPTLVRTGKDAVAGRNRSMNANATDFKNDVLDFDEFMAVCREVGAEPVIVVAADEYLVKYPEGSTWSTKEQLVNYAVEWVRYANIKKKYNIKYWMIGNETWGPENKNSSVDIYAQDVIDFSRAMKAVDPSILIVPNGNGDGWWKTILTKCSKDIDVLCVSNYPLYGLKRGFEGYRDTVPDMMMQIRTTANAIEKYADAKGKANLKVIVAEYGPFDWAGWPFINNMGYNLANFEITGQQLIEPKVAFSCFWNTRWIDNDSVKYSVFDALDKNGDFNANATGIMIWNKFLGKKMVATTSTMQIRTFASYSADKRTLSLYIINKSASVVNITPDIKNYKVKAVKREGDFTSTGPDDVNPVWKETTDTKAGDALTVNPVSIKVIEYQLN